MSFLYVDTLQEATSVLSACVLDPASLLVPGHDALHTYSLFDPTDPTSLQHSKSYPLHERIECVVKVPFATGEQQRPAQHHILTLLSDATVALHQLPSSDTGSLTTLAACGLKVPREHDGMPITRRPEGPACSHALPVKHAAQRAHVMVTSVFHGFIHIVKLVPGSDAPGPSHAATSALELSNTAVRLLDIGLTGAPPPFHTRSMGPKRVVQQEVHVRALQIMPAPDPASATASGSSSSSSSSGSGRTTCMVVLLHQNEGPGPSALNLDCLELDWHSSTLRPGPWSCQNVHPTTSVLLPFSPGQPTSSLQPGMLVFSSRSLQLFSCAPQPTAASLVAAMAAAQGDIVGAARSVASSTSAPPAIQTRLLEWALPGVPSCAEWLTPTVLVLGDSMAGLHLVSLGGKQPWMRSIQVQGPLAAPSVLCYLGSSSGQAGVQDGTLFLGSRISNSQTLLVPSAATAEVTPESSQPLKWTLANSALIKSLAPVQACVRVPDRQGAEDAWMLACCGVAPCGRLASMRLGVALKPFVLDGPEVPAGVRLFPLRAGPPSPALHHSHLAFSFDAAGCTDVLLLDGDSFTQTSLPGIDSSQPSLLLTSLPGGLLLQVTSSSVLCVATSGTSRWQPQPPAPLSLAAARGSWVAVISCSTLHLLQADPSSGELRLQHSRQLSGTAQVSMLAMVCLPTPGAAPGAAQDTYLVIGDWVGCSVTLLRVSDLKGTGAAAAAALELLLPGETPRSSAVLVAAAPAGGPGPVPLLLVGTNGGFVFMWELRSSPGAGAGVGVGGGAWQVAAMRQVRISNVAVELSEVESGEEGEAERDLPGALSHVYAHSGCDAILRLRAPTLANGLSPHAAASERVEVCRVHGSSGLRAVCPVHTPSMPGGMAWVDRDGRLLFGELELEEKLRWTTAYIGDTPSHACYHAASGCFVVLTKDVGGGQWMRLVHAETLRQVLAYRLAEGHYHTALAVEQLPCSSQSLAAAAAAGAGAGVGAPPPVAPEPGEWLDAAPGVAADGQCGPAPAAGKEFIVLASYLLYDDQVDPKLQPGLQRTQGLLSFFEIKVQVAGSKAAAEAAPDLRYSLLLHGTCRVPSLCMALCTAWPECAAGPTTGPKPQPSAAAAAPTPEQEAASRPVAQPLLIAGGQDGVHAFRVHVDDCNVDGARATQRAARAVKRVEALPFVVPPPQAVGDLQLGREGGAAGETEAAEEDMEAYVSARHEEEEEEDEEEGEEEGGPDGSDAGPSAGPGGPAAGPQPRSKKLRAALALVRRHLQRDWNQHVTLTPVARAAGLARAAVTSLHAQGSVVFASEFLGSVTALRLVSNDAGVGLVPLSADRHAMFAQAMVGLSETEVLAAAHPCGLLVLRRSPEDEVAVVQEKRKQAQAEREMGLRRGTGSGMQQQGYSGGRAERQGTGAKDSEALQLLGILAQDCPGMEAVCSARLCHSVYKIMQGRVGLRMSAADPRAASGPNTAAAPAGDVGSARSHALCLGSDGAVLAVVAAHRGSAEAKALVDLQQRIEGLPAAVLAGVTGVQAGGDRHAQSWQLVLGSSRDALEEAAEVDSLPGTGAGDTALPAYSVDGALIKLIARQPQESLNALARHLRMGVPDLTNALLCSQML